MAYTKPSRAEAKRLAAAHAQHAKPNNPPAPSYAHLLDAYSPDDIAAEVWDTVRPDHHDIMVRSQLRGEDSFKKHRAVVANYLAYRHGRAEPTIAAEAMTFLAIDAYYLHGMTSLDPKTRNDYRSRLRALAPKVNPGLATIEIPKFGRQSIKPPYSPQDEAVIRRYALRQRQPGMRRQLCAVVGLCAGAGGDSPDLRGLERRHIEVTDDGIAVSYPGARARTVTVRRAYEELVLAGIEGLKPHQLLIGRDIKRNNIVGAVVERCELDGAPHIEASRLRSTWMAWLMTRPVPLNVILDAAGLKTARTICDLMPYLPVVDAAAALRDGTVG